MSEETASPAPTVPAWGDHGKGRWLGDVPLSTVWADPTRNPRRYRSGQDALNASVAAYGRVNTPLHCVRDVGPDEQPYRVVVGYGRFAAAIAASLVTVPIVVDEFPSEIAREGMLGHPLSPAAAQSLGALTENLVREDMGSWDTAEAVGSLAREGMAPQQICRVLAEEGGCKAMSAATAQMYVRVAGLPQSAKAKLQPMGRTGFTIARRLLDISSLRNGNVWREQETLERITTIVAETVGPEPAPEKGRSEGENVKGWRFRALRVREFALRMKGAGSLASWVPILAFVSGDDSAREEAERAMGHEAFKLLIGRSNQ